MKHKGPSRIARLHSILLLRGRYPDLLTLDHFDSAVEMVVGLTIIVHPVISRIFVVDLAGVHSKRSAYPINQDSTGGLPRRVTCRSVRLQAEGYGRKNAKMLGIVLKMAMSP